MVNVALGFTAAVTFTFTTPISLKLPEVPVSVIAYAPPVVMAVLATVKGVVAITAAVPVTSTDDGGVQVTGLVAPAGAVVTAQVKATVPANAFDGVTVMVEVLPVVAPGTTETAVPVIAKLGEVEVAA
jgi:hypothetical protein